MKAIATFALLGLAYTFQDNELIIRPHHPPLRKSQPIKVEQPLLTVQTDDDEFFDLQNFLENEFFGFKNFMKERKFYSDDSGSVKQAHGNRDTISEALRLLRIKKEKQKEMKKNQKNEKVSQPQTSEENQENEP